MSPRWLLPFVLLAVAADLAAQRPRRIQRPGRGDAPAPAPEEAAPAPARKTKVERWVAVTNGDVHLGTGEVLRRATVLIGDDKIHAVGHRLEVPEGTQIVDAAGKVVVPGYVAVRCNTPLGLRPAAGEVADHLNPFDPTLKMAVAGGITSYVHLSGSGNDSPGGRSAVIKLAYGDIAGMLLQADPVRTMSLPLEPRAFDELRDKIAKAKQHLAESKRAPAAPAGDAAPRAENANAGGSAGGAARAGERKPPAGTEELLKLLDGSRRLWLQSQRGGLDSAAILQGLEIARLLGHGVVFVEPITHWLHADEIANTGSMVIASPRSRVSADPTRPDVTGTNFRAPAILAEAGVPLAVTPPSSGYGGGPAIDTNGILGQNLLVPQVDAAFAVRAGMDERDALRTLTLDAARIAGVADRIGSLEAGKDADLLILDGDPLSYKTFVDLAIVNGKVVYEKDKEPFYR
jgi:hypothetical protein